MTRLRNGRTEFSVMKCSTQCASELRFGGPDDVLGEAVVISSSSFEPGRALRSDAHREWAFVLAT